LQLAAHRARRAGDLPAQRLPAETFCHDLVDGIGFKSRIRHEIIGEGELADVAPRLHEEVRQFFLFSGD
jgi:hypothetical protein